MSKRRISKQQSARIQKNQQSYHQHAFAQSVATADGLVIKRYSRHASVEDNSRNLIHCSIRPNIDSLVSGDKVVWQSEGKDQGVIVSRYPRQTLLGRPNKQGIIKPIAANITQVMIVIAPKPEISWSLLDSYLVMAEHLNLLASIVLNKVDLIQDALKESFIHQYGSLGYPLIFTRHDEENGFHQLQRALKDQTSVFVGQSGVGKSSIIQKLLPNITNIQTQAISDQSELGRHTTSNSCLYHLPEGGALIDSPGVREFGLWHMPSAEIAWGYRDFRPYISECKFRNCNHRTDLGCALLSAVNNGLVTRHRYSNYVTIASQLAK